MTAAPPIDLQDSVYYEATVACYGTDWFHVDTYTHLSQEMMDRANVATIRLYQQVFQTASQPTLGVITNLWGTWSESRSGAHEGIDIARGRGTQVYSLTSGTVRKRNDTESSLYINTGWRTACYRHMRSMQVSVDNSVGQFQYIGQVSNISNNYDIGHHLHVEVLRGDVTVGANGGDQILDSADIYGFIYELVPPVL